MESPRALLPVGDVTAASRLLTLIGIVVGIGGLYFGRPVLIPLALAGVLAFLLAPIVRLVEKCHLGRVPSVLAVLLVCLAILTAIAWGMAGQLKQVMVHLPDYRANIHSKIEAIRPSASGGLGKATETVNNLSKDLSAAAETAGNQKPARNGGKEPIAVQVSQPPGTAGEFLRDVVGPLTGILETAGIVAIFTLFILMKREDLRNRLLRLAGKGRLNLMTDALHDASNRLSRYLLLQMVVNGGYGLLFGLGVHAIGIPHALLWGILACFFRFIPYVGSPVAALLPMAMAMAVFPGWSQVGLTFALFLVLEIGTANFIEPWLYGAHTGISSLAILVAAVFWGMLWGPVGLILSTPLTVCLILLGRYVPQLSFLEIVLGDEPVLSPYVHFYQRLLALDEEEATEIAENYLKENPLGSLYDSVLIPALSLAEHDRHTVALDESRTKFIHQSTRELIEELYEGSNPASGPEDGSSAIPVAPVATKVVCIPARDEADEIVGTMLLQLLRRAGHDVHALPIGPIPNMLEELEQLHADTVCVSALPPFAVGQAKSLCKQIRNRCPTATIALGLWGFQGGIPKARLRVGLSYADVIGTSLEEVVSLLGADTVLAAPAALAAFEGAED